VFIVRENNQFLKKWIMIMIWNLHSMTKLSGWLRHCQKCIPKVVGSIPTVVRQTFQLARCGCTLRVTLETSYSPEYITPTHTKINMLLVLFCYP
jgi:hypothetical protein